MVDELLEGLVLYDETEVKEELVPETTIDQMPRGMLRPTYIEVYASSLRGVGDTLLTMILSLVGVCIVRIVWVHFAFGKYHEFFYIIIAYPLSWFITAVLFTIYTNFFSKFRLWLRGDNITDLTWRFRRW